MKIAFFINSHYRFNVGSGTDKETNNLHDPHGYPVTTFKINIDTQIHSLIHTI